MNTLHIEPNISTLLLLTVQVLTPHLSITVSTLVDSSGNFTSQTLLARLDLPRRSQAQELRIETIQGKPLGRGYIKYQSPPVTLHVGCYHWETISFLVLEGPTEDIVLGRPCLS